MRHATLVLVRTVVLTLAVSLVGLASASRPVPPPPPPPPHGDPLARYTISSSGINATFIPYGARLTDLFVKDRDGIAQDVVMGYDESESYLRDSATRHSYMGAIVGRYANRIRNGTFTLDDNVYHIPKNSANRSTLHGGNTGYDQRNWTLASHTQSSITFSLYDHAFEGFPGDVMNYATYTVSPGPRFTTRLVSVPLTHKTPIMLSNHIYWSLGGFVNHAAQKVYSSTLHMPYSSRYVQVALDQVPNGTIGSVHGTYLDYTKPATIGSKILSGPKDSCGVDCTGYNNAMILDRPRSSGHESADLVVLSMSSPETGIKMDVRTNQQNLEIFSCNFFNGNIPVKSSQVHTGVKGSYDRHGCVVIEPQGWVDGINWPRWGQREYQTYGPDTLPAVNFAQYDFDIAEQGPRVKEEL